MAMLKGPLPGLARCGQCLKSWQIFREWEIRSRRAPTEDMLRLSVTACNSVGNVLHAFSRRSANVPVDDFPQIILSFQNLLDSLHYVQQEVVGGNLCVNDRDTVERITAVLKDCMEIATAVLKKAQSGTLPFNQSPNSDRIDTFKKQVDDFVFDGHDPAAALRCCTSPVCRPGDPLPKSWSASGYRFPRKCYDIGCQFHYGQKQDVKQSDFKYGDAQREIDELRTVIDIIQASPAESRTPQRNENSRTGPVVVSWSTQWIRSKDCCCLKVQLRIPHHLMAPPAFSFMLSFGSTIVTGDVEMLDAKYFLDGYVFTAPIPPLILSSISSRAVSLRLLVDSGSDSTNSGTTITLGSLEESDILFGPTTLEASGCQPPSSSEHSSITDKHQKETTHVSSPSKPPSGQKPPFFTTWIADADGYTVHTEDPLVIDGGRFLCMQCCERLRKQARSTSRCVGALFNSDGPCSDRNIVNEFAGYVAVGDEHCICQHCSSRLKREAKLKKCFISILFDVESASESSRPPRDRSYERTRPSKPPNIQPVPSVASSSSSRRSEKFEGLQFDQIMKDKTPKRGKSKASHIKAEADTLRLFKMLNPNFKPKASNSDWTENDTTGMLEDSVRMTQRQLQDGYNVSQREIDSMNRHIEELTKKEKRPNGRWEYREGDIVCEETYSEYSRKETRTGSGSRSGSRSST